MSAETKIVTLQDDYHVWTRREGQGPIKMLLLHGGPGMTHEYLEPFSDYIKKHPEVEIIYYDQLGSYFSDQPDDPTLWNIPRFIDEFRKFGRLGIWNNFTYTVNNLEDFLHLNMLHHNMVSM